MGSNSRSVVTTRSNVVVSSSVWDARMRMDQVKGGIKVFNGTGDKELVHGGEEAKPRVYTRRLGRNHSDASASADKRKRRNWRGSELPDKSPIQLRKTLSEPARDSRENCPESGVEKAVVVRSLSSGVGISGEDIDLDVEEEKRCDDDDDDVDDDEVLDLSIEDMMEPVVVEEDKKVDDDQIHEVPISSISHIILPDEVDCPSIDPCFAKPSPIEVEVDEDIYGSATDTQNNRMQHIVDLVMWRDISRSAFVFGIGTFLLISSTYTKDLNFSLISGISYLGLFYLAATFLYKSILQRVAVDLEESNNQAWLFGEEEAIWLIQKLLPYVNELLLKLKALFSGDPSTTMKMAMFLYVLARCGGSITIWTMIKLAFFGVFTIPRICSSYSVQHQIARYGKFWLERFRDAWETCTHKKAVAVAIFTLIWNLSSTAARVWAVFMLAVAVRYYQQCMVAEWGGGDDPLEEVDAKAGQEGSEEKHRHQKEASKMEVEMKKRRKNRRVK